MLSEPPYPAPVEKEGAMSDLFIGVAITAKEIKRFMEPEQAIKFIMEIDESYADCDFTESLLERLIGAFLADYTPEMIHEIVDRAASARTGSEAGHG